MSQNLLSVEDLMFSYGNRKIFDGISFDVKAGTVSCLLGPNGCGKTTLIDCILGYLQKQRGSVFFSGNDSGNLTTKELARQAASVPQHHEKHFPFTVSDVILMGRTAHLDLFERPVDEDRKKVKHLLTQVGLLSLVDRDYTELSGGETQIILILRALIQESPLIIMDEPASHLDFKNELILLEKIIELANNYERGILMTTHAPNQALFLENRGIDVQVLLMDEKGSLISGSPGEVLTVENIAKVYGIRTVQLFDEDSSFSSLVPLEILKR